MQKIKIAHVITRLIIGGAQENTLLSVEGLSALDDYGVDLITGPALGPEGSLMERALANNISVKIVPELRRNINPMLDMIAFFKLFRMLKRNGYTIVHTHSSKAGILGRMAAFCAGIPYVVHTIHGLPFHEYQNRFINHVYVFLERACARLSTCVITVCPEMTKKALAKGIGRKEQYETVWSGIECAPYKTLIERTDTLIRERFHIAPDAIVIGKIARLFHLKGHCYLIDAAEKIIRQYPETIFLLVGDGILRESLEKRVQVLGISKNFIFAGLVAPREIPRYINAMDIVVHLSLREGLPRVVPQAFLLKKPVVAYDIDGAKDIIDKGINGFLIKPKVIDELSEKIGSLVLNSELRRTMGNKGAEKAWKLFPHQLMVAHLDTVYKRLTNNDRRRTIEG
jgi:glycosyltransferase involved in cell wall biosynthesis